MSPPLISKAAARYTGAGGKEHCSLCRHFSPRRGGRCARVLGDISPMGWCKLFSREMRGLVADASSFNGGGGGPALGLDFMQPGSLDPSITFTRASTATYFDSAGVMQTAATNAPRWDYDPATLALRGLLIEEARTNVIVSSAAISGANWQQVAVTATAGQTGAPDGTAAFTRVVETTATGAHYVGTLMTIAASTAYTLSVFARAQQSRYLQLALDDGSANGAHATFDLQTGTISGPLTAHAAGVIGTASIVPVSGGTYRCAITTTIGAFTSGRVLLLMSNVAAPGFAPSYAGNSANGLLIWGAQLEVGAFATSYIPTTSAAVTRAQDRCSISAANMVPWFNALTGSWFAEFVFQNPTSPNIRILASLGQPAGGSAGMVFVDPAQHVAQYDGGTALVTTSPALVVNAVSKAASTWAAGTGQVCGNGGAVLSGAMPTGFGNLSVVGICFLIPSNPGVTDNATGYLRRASYWSRVLTAAEMQTVTTL